MQTQGLTYNVDIVMCIDATASMRPHIERAKERALMLHEDIIKACQEKKKVINRLRIRVIAFRDYYVDSEPMLESNFFELPAELEKFRSFVMGLKADGGGDDPENALEALALAMKSAWSSDGQKHRHIIVMFTDTTTHELDKSPKPKGYPINMPANMSELSGWWGGQSPTMKREPKRLVLFAPDANPWSKISSTWDQVIHHPAEAAKGLVDKDYKTIISIIVNTI